MPNLSVFWGTIGRKGHVWLPEDSSRKDQLKIVNFRSQGRTNVKVSLFTDSFRPQVTIRKNREVMESFQQELVHEYGIVGKIAGTLLNYNPDAAIVQPLTPRKIEEVHQAIARLREIQTENHELAAQVGSLKLQKNSREINCGSLLREIEERSGKKLFDEQTKTVLSSLVMKSIVRSSIVTKDGEPVDIRRLAYPEAIQIAKQIILSRLTENR
jgi:hypothetical protein